jgi:hypothetical protein
MSVTHFGDAPKRPERPYCGATATHPQVAADPAAVTCKRCLRFMSRWSAPVPVQVAAIPVLGTLDGYRPYHAIGCPARTTWPGNDCTCGGTDHPVWNPGDAPAAAG